MTKTLDDVKAWEDVTDAKGAVKLLALKVAEIARLENERHRLGGHSGELVERLQRIRREDLRREIIFYQDAKARAERAYQVDCSGFDSAIRYLLPAEYHVMTRIITER